MNLDDVRAIQGVIGGYVEVVKTCTLYDYFRAPVCMLVDEEGLLKELPFNVFGSVMYNTIVHGSPIVGDVLICPVAGESLIGFGDEVYELQEQLVRDFTGLWKERSK